MSRTSNIPWSRIGAESVAIVGSILLAFTIDAYWDGRQERRQEAEYLAAIIDEIDRNIDSVPGNRGVLDRSYADLLEARDLLRAGDYTANPGLFIRSVNRGLIYGIPTISTAVFDDLRSSGSIVLIEDPEVRRLITNLYALTETELVRFARNDAAALNELANAHTPPGVISQVGPTMSFDESKVSPEEMREAASELAAEDSIAAAINAELRRRETERAFLDAHENRLKAARDRLVQTIGEPSSTSRSQK